MHVNGVWWKAVISRKWVGYGNSSQSCVIAQPMDNVLPNQCRYPVVSRRLIFNFLQCHRCWMRELTNVALRFSIHSKSFFNQFILSQKRNTYRFILCVIALAPEWQFAAETRGVMSSMLSASDCFTCCKVILPKESGQSGAPHGKLSCAGLDKLEQMRTACKLQK